MYQLALRSYPNEEIRVSTSKHAVPVSFLVSLSQDEKEPDDPFLTCGKKRKPSDSSLKNADRPGWGKLPKPHNFSKRGRLTLQRVGGAFDKESIHAGDCTFLTATLPGSTPEAFETIAKYSGYIVHTLKAWVNKRVPSKLDFYVWEWQKRGALHLHYCVYIPDKEVAQKLRDDFPTYMTELYKKISLQTGVDLFDTGKGYSWLPVIAMKNQLAQEVEKSVARYLSKYVGKNAVSVQRQGDATLHYPVRWYGVSRESHKVLRKHSVEEIFYFVKRGELEKFYWEVQAFLANLSDVCNSWVSLITGLPQCVSYQSHLNLQKLMRMTNLLPLQEKQMSQQYLKEWAWTTSYLSIVMRRYRISCADLLNNCSPTSATAGEKLSSLQQLNIAETMDLIHALRWLSFYKFRDRSQPPLLNQDLRILDELYSKVLTMRLTVQMNPSLNCEDLFREYLTGKTS